MASFKMWAALEQVRNMAVWLGSIARFVPEGMVLFGHAEVGEHSVGEVEAPLSFTLALALWAIGRYMPLFATYVAFRPHGIKGVNISILMFFSSSPAVGRLPKRIEINRLFAFLGLAIQLAASGVILNLHQELFVWKPVELPLFITPLGFTHQELS